MRRIACASEWIGSATHVIGDAAALIASPFIRFPPQHSGSPRTRLNRLRNTPGPAEVGAVTCALRPHRRLV